MMCRSDDIRLAKLQDLNFYSFEFCDATGQFTPGIILRCSKTK
jgi:hypothetical protein